MPAYRWSMRCALIIGLGTVLPSCGMRLARQDSVIGPREMEDIRAAAPAPRLLSSIERHRFVIGADDAVVGSLAALRVREGETLLDVARHFGLGFEEITAANPDIDPWVPPGESRALIPLQFVLPRGQRRGIVINLAAMRLFHFPSKAGGHEVVTYPVGIGREGKSSPTGAMSITRKTKHPVWFPTANIRSDHLKKGDPLPAMVPAGPDNPLGDFAMYLSRPLYLIHGTNKPFSIGLRASNGCIRLYPENIAQLFPAVSVSEPVTIVNQPYLIGSRDGVTYLQAYHPQEELNDQAVRARIRSDLKALEAEKSLSLDWQRIERIIEEGHGIALPITRGSTSMESELASAPLLAHPERLEGQPALPPDGDGWRVFASETVSETTARRLAAFLNHQGPQVPARVIPKGDRFQVVAGPYPSANKAKVAAKRLQVDLDLEGQVLAPDTAVATSEQPVEVPAPPPPLPVEEAQPVASEPQPVEPAWSAPAAETAPASAELPVYRPAEMPASSEPTSPEPLSPAEAFPEAPPSLPSSAEPVSPDGMNPEIPVRDEAPTETVAPEPRYPEAASSENPSSEPVTTEPAQGETAPAETAAPQSYQEVPLEIPPEFVPAINSARTRQSRSPTP